MNDHDSIYATGQSQAEPGFRNVTRRILERQTIPEIDQELVMEEVTYAPGGSAPVHRHPVGGLVYIVEGIAESAYGSDRPRLYKAGETLRDRSDIAHTTFRNVDPGAPLRFLVFYAHPPGQPYVVEKAVSK
jgi:quercetin dioxygenase-like cupin family protein